MSSVIDLKGDLSKFYYRIKDKTITDIDKCSFEEKFDVIGFIMYIVKLNKFYGDKVDDDTNMYMRELDNCNVSLFTSLPLGDRLVCSVSIGQNGKKGLESLDFVSYGASIVILSKPKDMIKFMEILKLYVISTTRWAMELI